MNARMFSQIFLQSANEYPQFEEAVEIVKSNTLPNSNIWLIGGFVYRNIIHKIWHVPVTRDVDFDFIVEAPKTDIRLPQNWKLKKNSFGNPKFVGPEYEIDFVPLSNIFSIKRRRLEPTIDNFLSGVPTNVQAVVYNLVTHEILGDAAIDAITTKTLRIHNRDEAIHMAAYKKKSIEEFMSELSQSLKFYVEI